MAAAVANDGGRLMARCGIGCPLDVVHESRRGALLHSLCAQPMVLFCNLRPALLLDFGRILSRIMIRIVAVERFGFLLMCF